MSLLVLSGASEGASSWVENNIREFAEELTVSGQECVSTAQSAVRKSRIKKASAPRVVLTSLSLGGSDPSAEPPVASRLFLRHRSLLI
ncbi:MAG: hypothetical protein MUC38_08925 [Cyclobacteriaceae bacterium]|nr:hypothetical protein [Cyclobacteriaceae bacterium]